MKSWDEDDGTAQDGRLDRLDPRANRGDVGVEAAHDRYGGLDVPAGIAGMMVALASVLILAGLASAAIGAIAFQTGTRGNQTELSVGALITAGVVLFLAFLFGGWTAGRIARYNGGLNGFMVAVWFLVLLAILAVLGAVAGDAYQLFDNLQVAKASLPNWFSAQDLTTGAIISAIVYVAVMIAGAILGGTWGVRLHRNADELIAATRPGGIGARTTVVERGDR